MYVCHELSFSFGVCKLSLSLSLQLYSVSSLEPNSAEAASNSNTNAKCLQVRYSTTPTIELARHCSAPFMVMALSSAVILSLSPSEVDWV